jgi:effector-binding domain-containing protein
MSISEVRVGDSSGIPLAVVRRQAGASELSKVVPEGCDAVWSWLRARQLRGGRHVAIYWDGAIRLEVGVELIDAITDEGDVVRSATPAGRTASVVHLGPYNRLGTAHQTIREWCSSHNLQLAGPNWEIREHDVRHDLPLVRTPNE